MATPIKEQLIKNDYVAGRSIVCGEKSGGAPTECSMALARRIRTTTKGLTVAQQRAWSTYSLMPTLYHLNDHCKTVISQSIAQTVNPYNYQAPKPRRVTPKQCVVNILKDIAYYKDKNGTTTHFSARFASDIKKISKVFSPKFPAMTKGLTAATRKMCGTEQNTPFAFACAAALFDTAGMALQQVAANLIPIWLRNFFVPIAATAGNYCRTFATRPVSKPVFRKCVLGVLNNKALFTSALGVTHGWKTYLNSSYSILNDIVPPRPTERATVPSRQKTAAPRPVKGWDPYAGKDD